MQLKQLSDDVQDGAEENVAALHPAVKYHQLTLH